MIYFIVPIDERIVPEEYINAMRKRYTEIIRCKDCAKRENCRTSTVWAVAPNDDWYCADGERKEE